MFNIGFGEVSQGMLDLALNYPNKTPQKLFFSGVLWALLHSSKYSTSSFAKWVNEREKNVRRKKLQRKMSLHVMLDLEFKYKCYLVNSILSYNWNIFHWCFFCLTFHHKSAEDKIYFCVHWGTHLCEVIIMALPDSLVRVTASQSKRLATGSMPVDGSSRKMTGGPPIRAIPALSFLLLPPLYERKHAESCSHRTLHMIS